MKQLMQDLRTGRVEVIDVPAPNSRPGFLIVRTTKSLVSPGTERMLRDFGKANLFQKALQQPDKVRQLLDKARNDGVSSALEAVRAKLEQPVPLGYCNVGRVVESGGLALFVPGARVVSNGPHAEMVRVPQNLAARIPDNVDDDTAAFTVLGAIALQGIRLAQPTLGESVVVIGLGLVGLLAVQLLRAQGARVLGVDIDPDRCALAELAGAETVCARDGIDVVAKAVAFSNGYGVDAVLIAAATKSNIPIIQAAEMCRARGRIILIGVVGLQIPRDEFYRKELTFQVSCSYGPGRYDSSYEEAGQDYPIGFARWTAQRNFEAVLGLMANGKIDVRPFITKRAAISRAADAYAGLDEGGMLGILFDYPHELESSATAKTVYFVTRSVPSAGVRIGVIGAGNYASRVLIPAFKNAGASLVAICASGSGREVHVARKFNFQRAMSDANELMASDDVDLVVIATRHDSHARLTIEALNEGRGVYVEKPLALNADEVEKIGVALAGARQPFLMVGFNRRFSALIADIRTKLPSLDAPPVIAITVNAGVMRPDHWTQQRSVGGGRIIGEACHFIDLARYLAGAPIVNCTAVPLMPRRGEEIIDSGVMTLTFANGAVATINYLANGHRSFPKERVEIFCGGKVWHIENFRRTIGYGAQNSGAWFSIQDKGQNSMVKIVVDAFRKGSEAPIAFAELREVALAAIGLDQQLYEG